MLSLYREREHFCVRLRNVTLRWHRRIVKYFFFCAFEERRTNQVTKPFFIYLDVDRCLHLDMILPGPSLLADLLASLDRAVWMP